MKIINQVYETNDYTIFKQLTGNRPYNMPNIKRLKDSFAKKQIENPIIVNENFEVIDGQHRLKTCSDLGLPVHFIICNNLGLQEVQMLNSNMSNWKREDYLNSYCNMGLEPYLQFRDFMNDYPEFGIAASEALLTQRLSGGSWSRTDKEHSTNNSGSIAIKYFENGDLYIPDLSLSKKQAEMILQVKTFYEGFNRATFVRAMIGLFRNPNFDFSTFIKRLEMQPTALVHCSNVGQYKELIEEIYNYRSRNKVSLKY